MPSLAEYYRHGLQVVVEPGLPFRTATTGLPRLARSSRTSAGRLSTATFESTSSSLSAWPTPISSRSRAGRVGPSDGYILGRSGAKAVPDREWMGMEPTESTPRAATWRASSRLFSAVVPTSTARCSNRQRLQPCSSPSTNWIRGCRAWALRSSAATPAGTASSGTKGYCQASTRRSSWLPTTVSPHRLHEWVEWSDGVDADRAPALAAPPARRPRRCRAHRYLITPRSGMRSAVGTSFRGAYRICGDG